MKPHLETIIRTAIRAAAFEAGITGDPEKFDVEAIPYLIRKTEQILRLQELDEFLLHFPPQPWETDTLFADPANITPNCIFRGLFCIDEDHWREEYS